MAEFGGSEDSGPGPGPGPVAPSYLSDGTAAEVALLELMFKFGLELELLVLRFSGVVLLRLGVVLSADAPRPCIFSRGCANERARRGKRG